MIRLLTTVALAATASAHAAITVLDHFNTPVAPPVDGQGVSIANGTAGQTASSGLHTLGSGPLSGASRELTIRIDSIIDPSNFQETEVNQPSSTHFFQVSATSESDPSGWVTYSKPGGLNWDASGFTGIGLWQAYAPDKASQVGVRITSGAGATVSSTATLLPAGTFGANITFGWNLFAGIDITDIDHIQVLADPQGIAGDFSMHELVAVPEPATAAAVAGLLGLGMFARRFRR